MLQVFLTIVYATGFFGLLLLLTITLVLFMGSEMPRCNVPTMPCQIDELGAVLPCAPVLIHLPETLTRVLEATEILSISQLNLVDFLHCVLNIHENNGPC